MLREILVVYLEGNGYHVLVAGNGRQALEIFKEHVSKIALVFSDMGLPELSGEDMFYQLRDVAPGKKVILASGFVEPGKKSKLINAGVKEIVQKPYIPIEILKTIRKVIDG